MTQPGAERLLSLVPGLALFLIDEQHRLASWNEGVQRVLGWNKDAWIGQPFAALFTQEGRLADLPAQCLAAAGGAGAERDVVLQRQDGSTVQVALTLAQLPAEEDGSRALGAVCRQLPDATEPAAIEQRGADALAGAFGNGEGDAMLAAAFASALDAVPDGVYIGTQHGIVHCNRPALEMLGARSVQDLRARIDELGRRFRVRRERTGPPVPPAELPFVRALNGEPAVLETWATRPDGTDVFIRGTAAPIRVNGQLVGAVAINSDITQRLLLEEAAQSARREAERANRVKDEFLAVVSHELRAPLSALIGWATLLQRTVHEPASLVQKGLAAIDRNARLQSQLVDDLVDVTRIETGQLRLELLPVDLTEVIAAAVDAVHPTAGDKNLRIDVDIDAASAVVLGDSGRLQQVVSNLLANAIKFTSEGGSVRVSLQDSGDVLTIAVSDTGQGIDAAFLPHVFERFRQEDAGRTRRHGGLGLGLSIVRDLVRLHGGGVRADSAGQGCGATFTVTLPRHVQERSPS